MIFGVFSGSEHSPIHAIQASIEKLSQITGTEVPPINTSHVQPKEPSESRTQELTGGLASVYNIPPLPPNRVTIQAFRHLLLHRKKLIELAGKFHIPGSLTLGRTPAENSMENSELRSAYSVMRAEKVRNERLQCDTDTSTFQGYTGKSVQQGG